MSERHVIEQTTGEPGVGHAVNTSLHVAEYRSPRAADRRGRNGLPIERDNSASEWIEVTAAPLGGRSS